MAERSKKKTIVFFHPDLGIGGAERLVVDAAVGLQNRGHKIVIYTSHCDPRHCFNEARDGTLDVRVRGDTIVPPSIFSRFSILCAILRQLHLLISIYRNGELASLQPDAFFVDQLSAGLPLLQYLQPRASMLFYCHFPDLLLAQGRNKWYKKAWRVPFDTIEQWSMSFADAIAVNSKFTRGVVGRTWPALVKGRDLKVVYPCIDTQLSEHDGDDGLLWRDGDIILSLNRFERKKDVALAIKAYAGLSKEKREGVKLVVAGGYDPRVSENVSYHSELVELATSLKLTNATVHTLQTALAVPPENEVIFLLSVPDALKRSLLKSAKLLAYTPSNEHFGIVPIEAMLYGVPVLAANTGGPVETVVEGETGWLRSPGDVPEWTKVMDRVLNELGADQLAEMGRKGVERVQSNFAVTQMALTLDDILAGIENPQRKSNLGVWFVSLASAAGVFLVVVLAMMTAVSKT
ncbi:Alpha-1,3/1,6-mannosyltransferase alg-2 [Cytospora mali]|uniref:Alpha-1,3/1,6-mannosyltransferase ALG2 n=1 Tax=Cytospora mali TaxID=578113 RepID=A0A194VUC7_CYTMA|nr:Alpha-1,3/1,6-mannosyltransferase alg-2 [Valsa mali]